jgi:phenylacetate-CoA ligase
MSIGEWLTRCVWLPAHERLRGRATLAEMRSLATLLSAPADCVQAAARERLRALLRFAAQHLPYYTELFAQRGVDAGATDPIAALQRLPVMHKRHVRAAGDAIVWPAVPGGLQPCVSGGTSGDTLHFHVDRLRQAQSMGARLAMQRHLGVDVGARRIWLWGSPLEMKRSRVRRVRDRLLNEIPLDAFDMGPPEMDAYLRTMQRFRPRLIMAYASAATMLAQYARDQRRAIALPGLRAIVLTGDEVSDEDRRLIRTVFGAPVYTEYGSREVGLIAYECPHARLHVLTPHVHVEITQGDDAVPGGEIGNITCTNLNTRAQPFIRYHLGDVGRLVPERCGCGLPLPVLEIRGARITGFVALPSGRLCHGHLVAYLARAESCVQAFRVIQPTLHELQVLIVVDETYTPAARTRMQQAFARYFGPDMHVDIRVVDALPPDPSGKRRHVISHVAPTLTRYDVVESPAEILAD